MANIISDKIGEWAIQTPNKLAIFDYHHNLSFDYITFNGLIVKTQNKLLQIMPNPKGQRIALIAKNCVEQLVLMFAANRLGAIFVPLNWRLNHHEIEPLVENCGPEIIFYQDEFLPLIANIDAKITKYNIHDWVPKEAEKSQEQGPMIDDSLPAIFLYTSGTTGKPKAVVLSHANKNANEINSKLTMAMDENSVFLCESPFFHIMGLMAIAHNVLNLGGTLYSNPHFNPQITLDRLSDKSLGITHFFSVPQMTNMLRLSDNYNPEMLKGLKGIFTGGAPCPKELAKKFHDEGVKLINGYGMSEACGATIHTYFEDDYCQKKYPEYVGKPCPLVEVSLRDKNGKEVSQGELGEIWVRGPSIFSYYWRNEDATKDAFQDGWYKTGDAAICNEEGYYFIADRWKDMFISGGENVFPAEIEGVIGNIDGVKESAVIGVPDEKWGEIGVAFVNKAENSNLDEAKVIEICRSYLAHYKCPKRIVFSDILPKTGSGKIQKAILRSHYLAEK